MSTIAFDYALAEWLLNEYPFSYIHEAVIYNKIEELYKTKSYNGQKISYITRDTAPDNAFHRKISSLEYGGFIKPIGNKLNSSVYAIPSKRDYSPEEIVCSIYPEGYISHISAMKWHNITHKNPKTVHYTVPNRSLWKKKTTRVYSSNAEIESSTPIMVIPYPSSGRNLGFDLQVSQESKYVEPLHIRSSPVRVSNIGKTFVDMTRHPNISGGMDHVVDVFEEHGPVFYKRIIKYVDDFGTQIDKARIGFLLYDVSKVRSSSLDLWMEEAKNLRGSSRKINPEAPFESTYSPNWSISLNVEKLYSYGKQN